jgi:hypothetical protein
MARFSQIQKKLLILMSKACKLWISHISSKYLEFISETKVYAKMDINGREI